jgi:hypothetical protein
MDPNNKFHITVASSNRGAYQNYRPRSSYKQYVNRSPNSYGRGGRRYTRIRYQENNFDNYKRPYIRNAEPNDRYDSNRPVRRSYSSEGQFHRPKMAFQMYNGNGQMRRFDGRRLGYKPKTSQNSGDVETRRPQTN